MASQRDWLGVLAQAARIAIEEKHFRANLDAEQFAWQLDAIVLAYHHFARLLQTSDAKARAERAFEELVASARI